VDFLLPRLSFLTCQAACGYFFGFSSLLPLPLPLPGYYCTLSGCAIHLVNDIDATFLHDGVFDFELTIDLTLQLIP